MLGRFTRATSQSLSLRLLLFAGLTAALALAAAWVVLGLLFDRHAERQMQAELERYGIALIAALDMDAAGKLILQRPLTDPRFERPSSGLYWRAVSSSDELRSRSLWDGMLNVPVPSGASGWVATRKKGPFEDQVLVITRSVRLTPGIAPIQVIVATDRQSLANARAAFGEEAALFLLALWLALALAAWVQVRLGLLPLRAVGRQLGVMSSAIDARLSERDHPVEIRPLTSAINDLADQRARDVERARERARDLAHALKTPITALRMQIEQLDAAQRAGLLQSLTLLGGAVESELARNEDATSNSSIAATSVVARLLLVIARTPNGEKIVFRNEVSSEVLIPMGEENALEAFGALLDNAARHARCTVVIAGGADDHAVWLSIEDDGDGIAAEMRDVALVRGGRLDESGTRYGLGLSIARDFIEASGGSLALENSPLGGLKVTLEWRT